MSEREPSASRSQSSPSDGMARSVGGAPTAMPTTPVGILGVSRILLRWSAIVLPLIGLSVYLAATQTSDIDPDYTAAVSVLLVGPNEVRTTDFETGDVDIDPINPLNNLGGSLGTVATVTNISVSDDPTRQSLVDEGLTDAYAVWSESRSPIINIEVVDSDPDVALATTARLVDLIVADLKQRQDDLGAPDDERISGLLIDESTLSEPDFEGRDRVRIAIFVVGLGLSLATAFVLEGLSQLVRRSRSRRRARLAEWVPSDPPVAGSEEVDGGDSGPPVAEVGGAVAPNSGRPPALDVDPPGPSHRRSGGGGQSAVVSDAMDAATRTQEVSPADYPLARPDGR